MRVIRSAGQNVSPSDDGRLYDQIFTDGLFEDTTITNLGANNIALGTLYGVISGRDFTAEAQTIAAVLPEGDTEETGYIYVEIDTSSDDVITINSALAPFTPTYEDINTNGAVVQMILAEYTASAVAVTSITPTYSKASAGTVLPGSVATVEQSQAISNHSVGEYILLGGQLYKVTRAISAGETITPGSNVSATSAGAELNQLNNDLNNCKGISSVIATPIYTDNLSDSVLETYNYTVDEDCTVLSFYLGNGSNSACKETLLQVRLGDEYIINDLREYTSYGLLTISTPPFKKGASLTIRYRVRFSSGTASFIIRKCK
jgi:hypothetical protein